MVVPRLSGGDTLKKIHKLFGLKETTAVYMIPNGGYGANSRLTLVDF
jgi:hypothetical protein